MHEEKRPLLTAYVVLLFISIAFQIAILKLKMDGESFYLPYEIKTDYLCHFGDISREDQLQIQELQQAVSSPQQPARHSLIRIIVQLQIEAFYLPHRGSEIANHRFSL